MRLARPLGLIALVVAVAGLTVWAAELTKKELDAKLWPKDRVQAAIKAVEKQKADGLISNEHYQMKMKMLQARLAGAFDSTMLATTNPPLNFIQNPGFEEINKNSEPKRSRWLWWGGWDWGGDYENKWEERPEYVHSGKYSARIACLGKPGRIGLNTPGLPIVPGAAEYVFTIWAKGEGNNMLFLNFEDGASGTLRQKIGPEWTEVKLTGKPEPNAKTFKFYIYVTGEGTIWLDDAKVVPVGGEMED